MKIIGKMKKILNAETNLIKDSEHGDRVDCCDNAAKKMLQKMLQKNCWKKTGKNATKKCCNSGKSLKCALQHCHRTTVEGGEKLKYDYKRIIMTE